MIENDLKLNQITTVLREEFDPLRILFFGSRAQGTHKSDSDYDFVVVVKDEKRPTHLRLAQARALIRARCGVDADVWIYNEKEFEEMKDDFNSIAEVAVNTGRDLTVG